MTDHSRGIVLMLLAMAGFAIGDAALKWLGPLMGPGTLLLYLGIGGIPIFAAILAAKGERVPWAQALHRVVLSRNVIEIAAVSTMIVSLALLPLSLVIAVTQSVPIMAMAGAALFLGERVGPRRWTAVGVGFAGVVLMISPWAEGFEMAVLLPLASSVALAARDVLTRRIPEGIPNAALALWGNMALTVSGIAMIAARGEVPAIPGMAAAAVLLIAILFGASAYYAVTAALRLAPVPVVVPFRYSRLVFAAGLGIALFGERPGWEVWAGATLVVASGLYALRREAAVPNPAPAR